MPPVRNNPRATQAHGQYTPAASMDLDSLPPSTRISRNPTFQNYNNPETTMVIPEETLHEEPNNYEEDTNSMARPTEQPFHNASNPVGATRSPVPPHVLLRRESATSNDYGVPLQEGEPSYDEIYQDAYARAYAEIRAQMDAQNRASQQRRPAPAQTGHIFAGSLIVSGDDARIFRGDIYDGASPPPNLPSHLYTGPVNIPGKRVYMVNGNATTAAIHATQFFSGPPRDA